MKKNVNNKWEAIFAAGGVILVAATMRLLPHPPNVAPIAALALFSGANLNGWVAFVLPLLGMLVSDSFLGFHSTMVYVYGSFALIVLVGRLLATRRSASRLAGSALVSSLLFFLITNFGVWASTALYPKTAVGLVEAYIMGLPFLRNTLLGDFLYTFLFFYGYALLVRLTRLINKHENVEEVVRTGQPRRKP